MGSVDGGSGGGAEAPSGPRAWRPLAALPAPWQHRPPPAGEAAAARAAPGAREAATRLREERARRAFIAQRAERRLERDGDAEEQPQLPVVPLPAEPVAELSVLRDYFRNLMRREEDPYPRMAVVEHRDVQGPVVLCEGSAGSANQVDVLRADNPRQRFRVPHSSCRMYTVAA